jgi:hypothetical protein
MEPAVLVDTDQGKFHVGEKWNYRARLGEDGSTLTVVKVELSPKLGVIVHVSLDGLRIKSPHAPSGVSETIGHMPFAEQALEKSVTSLVSSNATLPAFTEGYQEWRRAFDAGKGGIFTIPVAEGVSFIETAMNK